MLKNVHISVETIIYRQGQTTQGRENEIIRTQSALHIPKHKLSR